MGDHFGGEKRKTVHDAYKAIHFGADGDHGVSERRERVTGSYEFSPNLSQTFVNFDAFTIDAFEDLRLVVEGEMGELPVDVDVLTQTRFDGLEALEEVAG